MNNLNKIKKPIVFIGFFIITSTGLAAPVDDLIAGAIRDNASSVRSLVKKGMALNARDEKGRTALTTAIQQQSQKVIPVLLQAQNIDINATNQAGESPLMLAIITEQNGLARQLIARGAAINKPGWTPLHYAATKGNIEMIRLLLDKDAYIDAGSPNRTTPLMMAAQYSGNPAAVQFLLQQGADPWMKNQLGMTALDFARRGNNKDIVRIIQNAQKTKKPQYDVKPLVPLSPASAAELKGLPIPDNIEPVESIYPKETKAQPLSTN